MIIKNKIQATTKLNLNSLEGLCKTQIIPLWVRWKDNYKPQPILKDIFSKEIFESSNLSKYIFSGINKKVAYYTYLGIIIRELIIDDFLTKIFSDKSNTTVVNLACGLDARHLRLVGYKKWIDIDLPHTIGLKRQFFYEDSSYRMIGMDLFNSNWMKEISENNNVILLCEGTLMYFKEKKIKKFFKDLNYFLPQSEMIFEIMGSWGSGKIHPFVKRLNVENRYNWGIKNYSWFEKNSLKLQKSESFIERFQKKWGLASKVVNLFPIIKLKAASQIYHLKFQ